MFSRVLIGLDIMFISRLCSILIIFDGGVMLLVVVVKCRVEGKRKLNNIVVSVVLKVFSR